jgi:hypothetical protein
VVARCPSAPPPAIGVVRILGRVVDGHNWGMADNTAADETDGARLLASVREALASWPDLGSHRRISIDQWNGFTVEERRAYQDIGIAAVRRVIGYRAVADQLRALGRLRYEPAVPTLTGLWEHCAVEPIRVAAAHALFSIGTSEARAVLRAGVYDHDRLARFMAVKTMFTDEGMPWDNVGWLFSGDRLATASGQAAAFEALRFLSPRSFSRAGDQWWLNELRDLLSRDRRWLGLCVGLRDHASLGYLARWALQYADRAVTGPALDAAAAAKAVQPRPRAPRLAAGSLVERYQRGDHRGVWRELGAVDPLDGTWRAEADHVAVLTMQRVRRNAERLVTALIARGWPVTAEKALPGPASDVEERLEGLEQLTAAPVPPALAAFWRVVGRLDLVPRELWNAPFPAGVPECLAMADPLEILDPTEAWFCVEEWQDRSAGLHPEVAGPLELEISADYLHKANISGGAPYSIWLPCTGADPLVREEEHHLSFTDYLRWAFANKGFLRTDRQEDWSDHRFSRNQVADATDWLAGVEYERTGF